MSLNEDVDLEEFIMAKDDLSGADIKAVCTEAGLLALRERRMRVNKADFTAAREKVSCFKCLSNACQHRTLILSARSCTGRTRVRQKACTCDWLSVPFCTLSSSHSVSHRPLFYVIHVLFYICL